MLELQWPWVLLLLPLPALVYFLMPANKREEAALLVPFYDTLAGLERGGQTRSGAGRWSLGLLLGIWLACVLAAARPQWIGAPIALPASGRDLLLAVDISGSMETRDMQVANQQVDRLSVVKRVVGEFVERRKSDRLGLVLFGTRAYLQAPLTFDRVTVNRLLQEAQLGFAGEKTAIGDAIGLSIKRLRERPESSRVLIVLTDGANTAGEVTPLRAAELAQQAKVKIYTIGIGADEMVTPGIFGGTFGARRINPSIDLDEESLKRIAEQTGGQYFRARDPAQLRDIYLALDQLEPIEQDNEVFRPTRALFHWPLGLALLLSFGLAGRQLYRRRPARQSGGKLVLEK
ncbi:VWA domain-containing protein [Exilibacterium tricleocarpae]|uniref:VWA domain-containing protein n=1 Tax=Exilibacterium tricleocarpae TaxID=2591008 RepID=A0A545TUW0_9GAMM|nr:VWA domain-containing protein [Exilibacterium tricleocarpae]TQV80996.1 VWA domain-containing protein [Exilibacterium tricleocarpae]